MKDIKVLETIVDGKTVYKLVSAANMKALVEQFAKAGEFANNDAVRSLTVHLTAVSRYEDKKSADKVLKHMEGFKRLLEHQKKNKLISEKAYHALMIDADFLIDKWQ